jgi:hypothetical protein
MTQSLKIEVLGIFHHQHEISVRQSIITPKNGYIGFWPSGFSYQIFFLLAKIVSHFCFTLKKRKDLN